MWRHDDPLTHAGLRRYSRFDRELVPEPPAPVSVRARGVFSRLVRLSLVVVAAAIVAYGFTVFPIRPNRPLPQRASESVASIAPVSRAIVKKPAQPETPIASANPSTPTSQPLDSEQAANLLQRGRELLRTGNIAGARLAFQPLTDAGNADAALALGETFDPRYLARQNIIGILGDEARARAWYQRAMKLGSTEAIIILARMAK